MFTNTSTLNYILDKFNLIKERDEIGKYRMPIEIPNFGRNQLADLFSTLSFNRGVEIGVESGVYSEILLKANPQLTLYSIDPWKSYRAYRDHTSQEKLDRFYEETKKRLGVYDGSIIVRKYSMDAIKDFTDNFLDFVYIDGNHSFSHVAQDIHYWLKKVKVGGIIAGHDYKRHKGGINIHVKQVVNAYTDSYFIKPWFVLGRNEKVEGEIRDGSRSWMWVKS